MRDQLGGIGLTEEQIDLANVSTAFCREKSPVSEVRQLIEEQSSHSARVWSEMSELGWLAIAIPEEFGGVGLSLAEVVPVVEQMGRALMSGPLASSTLASQLIIKGGTEAQKHEWLPKLARGSKASIATAESNGSYDINNIGAVATQKGDIISLSGSKILVTDCDGADLIIVSAKHNNKLVFVIVPRELIDPQSMRREVVIDETRQSFELTLDGIEVPESNVLDRSLAKESSLYLHLAANLLLAAEMCGGAHSCLEYTVEYLKTRKQFGKQIGAFQSLKHTAVDVYCEYEKARSHLYSAAWCFDTPRHGEIAVRMAKAQADKAFSFATDRAIQFHGGFGFTYDCDAQLYRRRAMWCAAQHGDASFHINKLGNLLF